MDIQDTLKERGKKYGSFQEHARISQNLKSAMHDSPNWDALPPHTKEAFEMVQHKIARALNGDPGYSDNPRDMAGYSQLLTEILEAAETELPQP
jgi:hypothetical protein